MDYDFWGKDFLHTEYYITSTKKNRQSDNGQSVALSSHVISGRPDLDRVFGKIKEMAIKNGEKRCLCLRSEQVGG
jgi:hypothetical protein